LAETKLRVSLRPASKKGDAVVLKSGWGIKKKFSKTLNKFGGEKISS
jgi:hypothetical protein